MKVVTRDEFVMLLRTRGSETLQKQLARFDLDMILGRGECAVHEGNLTASADWRLTTNNLLVQGAMSCGGLVDIAPDDRGVKGNWGGSLWTLGDLKCRNLANHYGASVVVDGDLNVAELAVSAFGDSMLLVTGNFSTYFYYGLDIWVELGGQAAMEYGDGYALPLGYDNAAAQAIKPRHNRKESLALLNFDDGVDELVAKLRLNEYSMLR